MSQREKYNQYFTVMNNNTCTCTVQCQTDKQTHRQTDRHTQTHTYTHMHTQLYTHRQTDATSYANRFDLGGTIQALCKQAYNTVSRPAYRLSVALLLMIAYHQPVQFRQLASSHTHMLLAHLTCTKEATLQPATFYTLVTATQSAA